MTRQTHANHSLGQRRGQYKQDCVVGLLVKIFRRLDARDVSAVKEWCRVTRLTSTLQ